MKVTVSNSRGQIALLLLIGIVIFGAFLIVSGGPAFQFAPQGTTPAGEPVEEAPGEQRDNLQLKTLKFKSCSSQLNIDLLLDRSGSMRNITGSGIPKIRALKEAVKALVAGLDDESLIGLQSFDSGSITDDVPISPYKNVKSQIPGAIDALQPGNETPTKNALEFSYGKLQEAKTKYPNKKISFIFVTDGIPVPASQDPRLFNPNPADEIKNLNIPIYTIGIHSPSDGSGNNFTELLRSIATVPGNYYEAPTGDEIARLLSQIKEKICAGGNPPAPILTPDSPVPTATPTPTPTSGIRPTPTSTPTPPNLPS